MPLSTAQARRPDAVIVVDNASTDGTADAVRALDSDVILHELERNTGGAGGFAYGIAAALRSAADLIWLMDDDTVPEPDALAALLDARAELPRDASRTGRQPRGLDGRARPPDEHAATQAADEAGEREAADAAGCVPVRSASFVSVLVDADVCRHRGAPVADYFLWNDDFEFTTRILRGNVGLLCPQSVVVHKTRTFGSTDADPGERFFYEVRNKIWLLTRSHSLAPLERMLYGGSTLRRWVRTIRGSNDRATLWRGLRRGLVAGLKHGPRSNEIVLAGTGYAR